MVLEKSLSIIPRQLANISSGEGILVALEVVCEAPADVEACDV